MGATEVPTKNEKTKFGMKYVVFLLISFAGVACYVVGFNDGMHVFSDDEGEVYGLLTTAVPDVPLIVLAVTLAAALFTFVWVGESFLLSFICKRSLRESLKLLAPTYLPFAILLIIPLRYFPEITGISSATLLLSTAMAQVLFFIAIILSATAQLSLLRRMDTPINPIQFTFAKLSDRNLGWILFVTTLAVITITIPIQVGKEVFAGDQPHYLIITHSLLEDGDIYIEDDHADRAYEQFTTVPDLPAQSMRNSHDGHTVPFHKIGISVLAVPFYALFGKVGAVWMIGLFTAFAVMMTFRFFLLFISNRAAAVVSTLWVWLSVPLLGLSHSFMTEAPLTAVALSALYFIYKEEMPKLPGLILLIVWSLPWLHTRGFAVAIGLTCLLLWNLRKTRRIWWLAGFGFVFALLMPLWNFLIYYDFSLVAQMGAASSEIEMLGITSRLLGLIFDSRYGILLFNPAVLCVIPGAFVLRRMNAQVFYGLLVYAAFVLGPALSYTHWWGGITPARYLAMAMPALGLFIAAFLADGQFRRWHGAGRVLIFVSCLLSVAAVVNTSLGVTIREKVPSLLAAVSLGPLDVVEWWPNWFVGGWQFLAHCILLIIIIRIIAGVGHRLWRYFYSRKDLNSTAYITSSTFVVFILAIIVFTPLFELLIPGEPNRTSVSSRENTLEFARRYRSSSFHVIDLLGGWKPDILPQRGFSAIRLFSRKPLVPDAEAPNGRYYPLPKGSSSVDLAPSVPFWAGDYEALIVVAAERPYQHISFNLYDLSARGRDSWNPLGQVRITDGSGYTIHTAGFSLKRNSIGLRWTIESDDKVRFAYATVKPLRYVTESQWELPADLFERITLQFNEYDLFVIPGNVYPPDNKWFWTRANLNSEWTVLSRRNFPGLLFSLNSRPQVVFTAFGMDGPVSTEFNLAGGQVRLRVPIVTDPIGMYHRADIRLEIRGSYIPGEILKDSKDFRRLGTHTRIALAHNND